MTQSSPPPKLYLIWMIGLGVMGALVSMYSIGHHHQYLKLGITDAACNINAKWSCDAVAGSAYSEWLGLPLGVWGLGFFLALVVIAATLLPKKPFTNKVGSHVAALVLLSYVGVAVAVVLATLSFAVIKFYCLSCVVVYALNIGLGVVSTYYLVRRRIPCSLRLWPSSVGNGAQQDLNTPWSGCLSAGVIVLVVFAGYYYFAKPRPDLSQMVDHPVQPTIKHQRNSLAQNLSSTAFEIKVHRSAYGDVGEDYRLGVDTAPIVVVEFIDFECPACARSAPMGKGLVDLYPESVTVVIKNFPLSSGCNPYVDEDLHPHACELAILARCAGAYGKFWSYHDRVFAKQASLKPDRPQQWSKDVGLTDEQISQCLSSEDIKHKITADIEEAYNLGVRGTPTIFINGRKYTGLRSLDTMAAVVDTLLLLDDETVELQDSQD